MRAPANPLRSITGGGGRVEAVATVVRMRKINIMFFFGVVVATQQGQGEGECFIFSLPGLARPIGYRYILGWTESSKNRCSMFNGEQKRISTK